MNLVFVIKSMSMAGGGAERVLVDVTSKLAEYGHRITIFSFDKDCESDFYPVDARVTRVRLDIGRTNRRSGIHDVGRRIRALRAAITNAQPDVAIGFMASSYIPVGLALWGTGIPVVASEHTDYNHWRRHRVQFAAMRATLPLYRAMTVLSDRVRANYPVALINKMVIIPNPVTAAPIALASPTGRLCKSILAVGRLSREKDHQTLIAAFAAVSPCYPNWKLRIIGEGELRGQLEQQIVAHGLGDRIALPGTTSEIDAEYRQAQIFAHPALYESFGLVTAEALAHGLPAVGFAECPGTNELIIDGHNGLLVSGEDRVGSLGAALDRLMGSSDLRIRLGQNGPASITRYSLAATAERWVALLSFVAARSKDLGDNS